MAEGGVNEEGGVGAVPVVVDDEGRHRSGVGGDVMLDSTAAGAAAEPESIAHPAARATARAAASEPRNTTALRYLPQESS